jgi:hypothetical protein
VQSSTTGDGANGISAFASYQFLPEWALFGRFDSVDPNDKTAATRKSTYFNVGLGWTPVKTVDLSIFYKHDGVSNDMVSTGNGTIGGATNGSYNEIGLFGDWQFRFPAWWQAISGLEIELSRRLPVIGQTVQSPPGPRWDQNRSIGVVKRGSPSTISASGGGGSTLCVCFARLADFGLERLTVFFTFALFADLFALARAGLRADFFIFFVFFFFMRASIAAPVCSDSMPHAIACNPMIRERPAGGSDRRHRRQQHGRGQCLGADADDRGISAPGLFSRAP